jgi:hypothetical protein
VFKDLVVDEYFATVSCTIQNSFSSEPSEVVLPHSVIPEDSESEEEIGGPGKTLDVLRLNKLLIPNQNSILPLLHPADSTRLQLVCRRALIRSDLVNHRSCLIRQARLHPPSVSQHLPARKVIVSVYISSL